MTTKTIAGPGANDAQLIIDAPNAHSFSYRLANSYGYKAAIIMGYLANRIQANHNIRNGHRWFFVTLEALAEQYPYMKRTSISEVLEKQVKVKESILRSRYNRMPGDRTWWYAFAKDEDFREALNPKKPIYFMPQHAVQYKRVLSAVLVLNMNYWFNRDGSDKPCRMSAHRLATIIPFSEEQILSALDGLFWDQVVKPVPVGGQDKAASYLPGANWPWKAEKSEPQPPVVLPEMPDGKQDIHTEKADMHTVKADNNTYYKHIENEIFETHSTLLPAEPSTAGTALPKQFDKEGLSTSLSQHNESTSSKAVTPRPQGGSLTQQTATSPDCNAIVPVDLGITSFHELATRNKDFDKTLSESDRLNELIQTLVVTFIQSTSPDQLHAWSNLQGTEQLFNDMHATFCSTSFLALAMYQDNASAQTALLGIALERFILGCCSLKDKQLLCGRWGYNAAVEITRVLEPFKAQKLTAKIEQDLAWRETQFISPHAPLETQPNISAFEKVKVFKSSLTTRNQVGAFTKSGKLVQPVVQFHDGLLKPLNTLFADNPSLTVAHLNRLLDECVKLHLGPSSREERDPYFYSRKGTNLYSFLKHLDKIVGELAMPGLPAIKVDLAQLDESSA
jgi:hypothetical protein